MTHCYISLTISNICSSNDIVACGSVIPWVYVQSMQMHFEVEIVYIVLVMWQNYLFKLIIHKVKIIYKAKSFTRLKSFKVKIIYKDKSFHKGTRIKSFTRQSSQSQAKV